MEFKVDYSDECLLKDDLYAGRPEAYRYLFDTYYLRLSSYASHFITDQDAVEDLIQDCFLRIYEKRKKIIFTSVKGLVFRVLRNICLNYLRHQALRYKMSTRGKEQEQAAESLYYIDFLNDPYESLLYDELKQQVDSILDNLPSRTRTIFMMSRFEGLKNREIAMQLGISIKVVERHVSRALKSFQQKFGQMAPFVLFAVLLAVLLKSHNELHELY